MKKVFLAILTLLYISASVGFTLHANYCIGTLSNDRFSRCAAKVCDMCGSEKINKKDNLCCKHENKFVKNGIDQNIPEPTFHLTHLSCVALIPFAEISFNKLASATDVNAVNHAPPPNSRVAIYLRDRVFRI